MLNNQVFSIGDIASALAGAGLTQITTNIAIALLLIGVGVILEITVAILQKKGIEVSTPPIG